LRFFLNNRTNIGINRTIKIRIHSGSSIIVSGSVICVGFGEGESVGKAVELGVGVVDGFVDWIKEGVGVGLEVGEVTAC